MKKPLSETHPDLAVQWHPVLNVGIALQKITEGSSRKVWWVGTCKHEWESTVYSRAQGGGCPYCLGKKVLSGFNDLRVKYPELAKEWHPVKNANLSPDKISPGSHKKVWWLGLCGHAWQASPKHRAYSGSNCPFCSGNEVLEGFNDLKTKYPEIAKEWHPTKNGDLSPSEALGGGRKKAWWLGKCGHAWNTSISNRLVRRGCPYCSQSNAKVLAGHNDLKTKYPEIAKEWHPTKNGDLSPSEVLGGSNKKVWWIGSCRHEWDTSLKQRLRGYGCPYCSGRRTLSGFNDLVTLYPELAKEWHPTKNGDLNPSEVTSSAHLKVWWMDEHGHEWITSVNVRQRGRGCPKCSVGGFRSTDPATFYFLHNPKLQAFKAGITNQGNKFDRIAKFQKLGWQLIERWDHESGLLILNLETQFFQWLRQELHIPVYLDTSDMKSTSGATETFSDSIISQDKVLNKIEELMRLPSLNIDNARRVHDKNEN